jgi:hypothetical protein
VRKPQQRRQQGKLFLSGPGQARPLPTPATSGRPRFAN